MQLILIKDVPHLGSLGDQVSVKDGYARNYLLPRGLAIVAGSKNAGQIAHRRRHLEVLRQAAIQQAKSEAEKVAALQLEVHAKAGANGRLFGSVTNRDIQAALQQQGYTLDRRSITLTAPIKNVGTFTAMVKLHTDVKTEISIKVVPIEVREEELPPEGEAAPAQAAEGAPAEGAAAAEGTAPAEGAASEAPSEPANA